MTYQIILYHIFYFNEFEVFHAYAIAEVSALFVYWMNGESVQPAGHLVGP
jgi:hypothetical protein